MARLSKMSLHTSSKDFLIRWSIYARIRNQIRNSFTYIHQVTDDIFVNLVVVSEISPRKILQIGRQVLEEPPMSLDFTKGYSFDWISLEHALNQILDVSRYLSGHVVISLLYFSKQEGQLLVIKR